MHYDHNLYHPYRSDRGYFLNEFKKEKPPKFDGEMKKPQDAKQRLIDTRKLFHEDPNNMKARLVTFSLKGKENI